MAPIPPNFFVIINRVLSPNGERLAVEYKGLDKNLTLEPLDEGNQNQVWVIRSPTEPTTIVPIVAGDEQAAQHLEFVVAKNSENLKSGNSSVSIPPPPRNLWLISGPTESGTAEKRSPITLDVVEIEPRSFTQTWILKRVLLPKE
ncbi:hypothetical protein BS47DRAFT_1398333 [Hydnum rufescens UP504]|uniref:CCL2-like lectin domain-containing protein n=1 Tax=Hydnum rufescens UP504 TaxID=1448309 RepID=A0A9P6DQT8_9AGAM|nr:hypothetical protein BS47DRAFT_1398333 [Hydnum rufescens UP504]